MTRNSTVLLRKNVVVVKVRFKKREKRGSSEVVVADDLDALLEVDQRKRRVISCYDAPLTSMSVMGLERGQVASSVSLAVGPSCGRASRGRRSRISTTSLLPSPTPTTTSHSGRHTQQIPT